MISVYRLAIVARNTVCDRKAAGIEKNHCWNVSFWKSIFDFLRKLVCILLSFHCFQRDCGLREVPPLPTLSRMTK